MSGGKICRSVRDGYVRTAVFHVTPFADGLTQHPNVVVDHRGMTIVNVPRALNQKNNANKMEVKVIVGFH